MAIVASTDEMLFNLRDVKWSLEKHLGSEYAETVENIVDNIIMDDYIPYEEHSKEIKQLELESEYYHNYIIDIHNQLDEIMNYMLKAKRLDKKKVYEWIKEIYRDIHENF